MAAVAETHHVNRSAWRIPPQYQDLNAIGKGTFGSVCSALHVPTNTRVAIKKLNQSFVTPANSKRTYREIMLLQNLKHDNIIELMDSFATFIPGNADPDIYLVTNLMGSDLYNVLQAQYISDQHVQFIIYQILRGLVYLHSAGVIHRDLKPGNIAVSQNCDVKILDFGLARPSSADGSMTGYVQTRWYRTPEIILGCPYDEKPQADMWSVGCILAEMLCGQVLFPGANPMDQVNHFVRCLGPLPADLIVAIDSPATRQYFLEFQSSTIATPEFCLEARLSQCSPLAFDLVKGLLRYSPKERMSAKQAIAHMYVGDYHDPQDEPEANFKFDDSFEGHDYSVDQWKELVLSQVRMWS